MAKIFLSAALVAATCANSAVAQIALSAHDGKQPQLGAKPSDVKPDSVQVIDLGQYPPKVLGGVEVPVSMIGPPTSLAVAHDNSFGIVTASQQFDPADSSRFILNNKVSVIDLKDPAHPVVIQTLDAGAGATGVSINRAGTLALVASTGEGTVSVFSISRKVLTRVSKVQLDPKPGPVDVAISPDGKIALVTQRYGTGVWRLAIDGTKVTDTGTTYATGGQPYGAVFSRDGKFAYNTNLLGRASATTPPAERPAGPRIGTVTAIDLRKNIVATTIDVGPTPEHVALSPDGRFLAVVVVNGSSASESSPNYNNFGLLKIYAVKGAELAQVAEVKTGRWGQGAAWSRDGKVIVLQGAIAREIEVFKFNSKSLTRDAAATLRFDTRPGAINSALSR